MKEKATSKKGLNKKHSADSANKSEIRSSPPYFEKPIS